MFTRLGKYSWSMDIFFIITIVSSLFFFMLGVRPLFVPDEANYAEIAREMFINHDYITPYLNGIKFFDKPILLYWFGVGVFKLFGVNLWAIRSVNALMGLLGCLLTYMTARKLYDRTTGLLAAGILGTSALYFVLSHVYTTDLMMTVFVAATLFAFILGINSKKNYILYFMCASVAAGLAVLTKGLIGILLPGIIILVWSLVFRQWKWLQAITLIACLSLFLNIVLPWHLLAYYENPSFLYFYFIEHHFIRFESGAVGHLRPVWYYIPVVLMGFFPWIFFLPQAIGSAFSSAQKNILFFVFSVFLIFLFFTISKAKLVPYILIIFPLLSIIVAYYIREQFKKIDVKSLRKTFTMLFLASIMCVPVFLLFPKYSQVLDPVSTKKYLCYTMMVFILGSLISFLYSKNYIRYSVISTCIMAAIMEVILMAAVPSMDGRPVLPLTNVLKSMLKPGDEVISLDHYYSDLPFYLEKKVAVLDSSHLFTYGLAHQSQHDWMLNQETFKKKWLGQNRIFAVMDLDEYINKPASYKDLVFYPVAQTKNFILVSNIA